MQTLADYNFKNKRVLVRCDFNLPVKNGRVLDVFRLERAIETIQYLKNSEAKIILISHLGQPVSASSRFSLAPIAKALSRLLKEEVRFLSTTVGRAAEKASYRLRQGEILLLENLRFEKGETDNDLNFARELSHLGDCFVEEAFSACHRSHASVALLPTLLPAFAGLGLKKEIEALSYLLERPNRPLLAIIGGMKAESKLKVAEKFLEKADYLLLGGKVVNMILNVKGICPGRPWPEEEAVQIIKRLNLAHGKLHLPVDVLVSPDEKGELYIRRAGPGNIRKEEEVYDIGPETIRSFKEIIALAKTIFWAGPLGLVENKNFRQGTIQTAEAVVSNRRAFKVAGGGDTIAFLRQFDYLDKFSYISTGGGAMLAYLAGEKLPGLLALEQ